MPSKPKRAAPKDRQFVTSLARGLQVLQCFTASTPELGTSEISRATGMPQPTVWRLCHTLTELGFLVADPSRQTLRPGIPLLGLGFAVLADQSIAQLALPDMSRLAARHSGAVSLGSPDGLSMIYLQRCQGSKIILADLRVGSRVPMASSATGWAYLAGLDSKRRAEAMTRLKTALGRQWQEIEPRLTGALKDYEKTGYVVNLGSLHPGINSVSVPVAAADGITVLALSSGGIREQFDKPALQQIGGELRTLASKLAPLLSAGFRPGQ